MKLIRIFTNVNRLALLSLVFVLGFAALIVNTVQTSANPTTTTFVGGRTLRVVSTDATPGEQVTVSIELDSQGDEVAASFTVDFEPEIFSNPVFTLGSGAPAGAALSLNVNQVAAGRVGILVDATNSFTMSPPNQQVITVTFDVAPGAPSGPTPITLVSSPTPLSVSSPFGSLLQTTYMFGTVTIAEPAAQLVTVGGRVTTPGGQGLRNALVRLIDSNNVRRTATTSSFGLYTFNNVETGSSYTITVSSRRYRFSSQVVQITDNVSNLDFVGLE